MIKAKDVTFEYTAEGEEPVFALSGLNINIKKGSFAAVIGRNGSGKSTFAKLVNGLLVAKSGTVFVNGLDAADEQNVWDIRRTAGMVFQNPDNQLVATIVEEDVAFGPENLGVPSQEIAERVQHALEAVGMSAFADDQPHNLSGGQKQRVAIAGILAMQPQCLILDEPTAMLDPIGRRDVLDILTKLNNDGITVVLITHFMDEAVRADTVFVVDGGVCVMEGAPSDVFVRAEELKGIGLDVPTAVLIAGRLADMGFDVRRDTLTIDALAKEVETCFLQ